MSASVRIESDSATQPVRVVLIEDDTDLRRVVQLTLQFGAGGWSTRRPTDPLASTPLSSYSPTSCSST